MDDITAGIKIPEGEFVELVIEEGIVFLMDSSTGEIYEAWMIH